MGYLLRSRSVAVPEAHSKGNTDDQTNPALPKGSGSKNYGTLRMSSKHAEKKSDGVLRPVDGNIRRPKPRVKKALLDRCSKPRRKLSVSFPNLEQWYEGRLGRNHNKPSRIEQENAEREDTDDDAIGVKEKPSIKSGTASFQWLPAPQTTTTTTNDQPVFYKIGKPPSEHAVKMAEKAEFHATYVTADPSWIICCALPRTWMLMQSIEDFSSNCVYRLSILAQRESCSSKALEEFRDDQEARDRVGLCRCQQPADYPLQATAVITRAGFDLIKHWREKLSYQLIATRHSAVEEDCELTTRILTVVDEMLEDFKSEWSADQYRKRPLPLWARVEAMAWVFQALPPYFNFCVDWSLQQRVHRCVMLVGSAILTTIEVLIQYKLFKASSTVHNLSLVLALLTRCASSMELDKEGHWSAGPNYSGAFNNYLCRHNENGWVSVVIDLAQKHGVIIHGVDEIDEIIRCRLKTEEGLKAKRDEARVLQHTMIWGGVGVVLPSEERLADAAWREGRPPYSRAAWKPADDFDGEGIRYWKRWHFVKEYKTYYSSAYSRTRGPCDQYRG